MFVRTLTEQKYLAKIADAEGNEASHPVTIDEVHVLKKGQYGLMLGVKVRKGCEWLICGTVGPG